MVEEFKILKRKGREMKRVKAIKWATFEYNDEDWCSEEVLKIKTSTNTDDDCYLTKGEMRSLFFFLEKIMRLTGRRK